MNRFAHSFYPVGMLHMEKWPIRRVNKEVVGLSSSQKRLRVLAANREQSTNQQRALAGESSSSSSLATAKGQGRAFTSSCSVLVRPHLGQHPGKAWTKCSNPSTAMRQPGMTAFPCGQRLWEQGLSAWEKGWLRGTNNSSSSST